MLLHPLLYHLQNLSLIRTDVIPLGRGLGMKDLFFPFPSWGEVSPPPTPPIYQLETVKPQNFSSGET
jgi:hypothetical protein